MSSETLTTADTRRAHFAQLFDEECQQSYPLIDGIEARTGYAVDRRMLYSAARVLACPIKAHRPNWQHGRLLYSLARLYLDGVTGEVTFLDIGTAKGFSALCLKWAIIESNRHGQVFSVDVIDPHARVSRNTVGEIDGLKTLRELLQPWPESVDIVFLQSTGVDWLQARKTTRIHISFVDGKHSGPVVRREGVLLSERQETGDLAIFDDLQIPDVSQAVTSLDDRYRFEYLDLLPHRQYAVGVRR